MGSFKPSRMRRTEIITLGQALSEYVKVFKLDSNLGRQAVFDAWDQASDAGRYTSNKYLRDNVLYVTISSSVVRSQLTFQREHILERINSILREDEFLHDILDSVLVKKIVLR